MSDAPAKLAGTESAPVWQGEEHDGVRLDSARKETEEAQSAAAAARARTGRAGKGRVAQLACTDVVIKQTLTFEAGRAVVQDLNTPAMLGKSMIMASAHKMRVVLLPPYIL